MDVLLDLFESRSAAGERISEILSQSPEDVKVQQQQTESVVLSVCIALILLLYTDI